LYAYYTQKENGKKYLDSASDPKEVAKIAKRIIEDKKES